MGYARRRSTGLTLATVLIVGCVGPSPDRPAEASAVTELDALADDVWAFRLQRDFQARLREGLPIERLPDFSLADAEEAADFYRGVQARLASLDRAALPHDDALTYDVIARDASVAVETLPLFWHQSVLTPYSSALGTARQVFAMLPLETSEDRSTFLSLLGQVPALVAQVREIVEKQLELGIAVPAPALPAVVGLLEASVAPADQGPFAVAHDRFGEASPDELATFEASLVEIVETAINPAVAELSSLVRDRVAAAASDQVGLGHQPGGDAAYRFLVRYHTTLDITPEEVQTIGHEMVADLQEAMDAVQDELGFVGDRAAFRAHLLADRRFYADTPEEVGAGLMRAAEAMTAGIDRFFAVVPEAPYDVRRLPPSLEASMTYGYYDPPTAEEPSGYYNYNASDLDQRSLLGQVGLSLHELIPGHHFQIARQFESDLHPIRRYAFPTAYVEGWGSYASYLGFEAGVADDPYDRYGIYTLELFLANRLVVDPGMNAFGWSLDRAREYMRENTFESDTQIATETLRYSTDMPGQALAYQIGKRKLLELRQRAEHALGDRFELRRFHEAVLTPGALPLQVLDGHIDWWIEKELGR